MSRGPGKWQRRILETLEKNPKAKLHLRGASYAETVAITRAARALERAGRCVVVRLWDDDHRTVRPWAFAPGVTTTDGRPIKELSVVTVPRGTATTFKGSCRDR